MLICSRSQYFPKDSDIIRERQVRGLDLGGSESFDFESQTKHGNFHDGNDKFQDDAPIPLTPPVNPLRERSTSDNSDVLSSAQIGRASCRERVS